MEALFAAEDDWRRFVSSESLFNSNQEVLKILNFSVHALLLKAFVQIVRTAGEDALRPCLIVLELLALCQVHVFEIPHLIKGLLLIA